MKQRGEWKMKKNYLLVLMFAYLLIILSSCSDANAGETGNGIAKGEEQKKTIKLKLAVSQPVTHKLNVETFVPFMEKVTELTDGQVEFDFYPAEQLGKVGDILDLTSDGVIDLGLYMSPYYPSTMSITNGLLTDAGIIFGTAYEGTMAYHELSKKALYWNRII